MIENKDKIFDDDKDGESELDMEEEQSEEKAGTSRKRQAYMPGISRALKANEELDFDKSAYRLFHSFQTEYPCLSFDTLFDENEGMNRDTVPTVACKLVAGTNGPKARDNHLVVMKLANLTPFKHKENTDEDEESDSSEDEEETAGSANKGPIMQAAVIAHQGGVNRLRAKSLGASTVCAVWNDQAKVQLWNLTDALKKVNEDEDCAASSKSTTVHMKNQKPLFSFVGHQSEGYALDWSPNILGRLASGDNLRRIHIWTMGDGGVWVVDQRPLAGHTGSVEDLQWSPNEDSVLASCSSDGSICLWDVRAGPKEACVCTVKSAHDRDVNVISWNKTEPLLVSGGDDGQIKIWDLKTIQYGQSVARFKHHTRPITSVDWYSHDSTVFMASGEDDQITIWDLALEKDEDQQSCAVEEGPAVPPQLLFIHLGQKEVKEVKWHEQFKGLAITTALSGFNIFRTINV